MHQGQTLRTGTAVLFAVVLFCAAGMMAASAGAAVVVTDGAGLRTWSDRSGTFNVRASLTYFDGDEVTLLRDDGKEIVVPLAKLSDADQQYVADVRAGKLPEIEFDAGTGEVKARRSAAKEPFAEAPSKGYIDSEADISVAPILALSAETAWKYKPDGVTPVKPIAAKQVRLPVELKGSLPTFQIARLAAEKQAIISITEGAGFENETSTLLVCDFTGGRVKSTLSVSGETLLAASPDGKLLVTVLTETAGKHGAELRLYRRDGTGCKRLIAWRPYGEEKLGTPSASVAWAAFADTRRLLTMSNTSWLALWDVPEVMPQWCAELERGAVPAVSPGGKYLAATSHGKMAIVDLAASEIAGSIVTDLSPAKLAFHPDGRRLAGIAGDRICVWNLETRQTERDFNLLESGKPDDQFAWIDDAHLLAGDFVIDVERRVPIWQHLSMLGSLAENGRLWFVARSVGGKEPILASTRAIPQQALDAVADLKPEDLLVLHPGLEVSVELQASGDVQSARDVLERKLTDNGMKVVSRGRVRLIGTVTAGETRTIHIRDWGDSAFDANAGTTHTITDQLVTLCFKAGDQTIWRRDYPAGPPPIINLKEGETKDQALQRLTYRDASHLTGFALPRHLARLPESATK